MKILKLLTGVVLGILLMPFMPFAVAYVCWDQNTYAWRLVKMP